MRKTKQWASLFQFEDLIDSILIVTRANPFSFGVDTFKFLLSSELNRDSLVWMLIVVVKIRIRASHGLRFKKRSPR
jgi:hypothetical protein